MLNCVLSYIAILVLTSVDMTPLNIWQVPMPDSVAYPVPFRSSSEIGSSSSFTADREDIYKPDLMKGHGSEFVVNVVSEQQHYAVLPTRNGVNIDKTCL